MQKKHKEIQLKLENDLKESLNFFTKEIFELQYKFEKLKSKFTETERRRRRLLVFFIFIKLYLKKKFRILLINVMKLY